MKKKHFAHDIRWDTDGDMKLFKTLPQEIEIPEDVWEDYDNGNDDAISDYVSDVTGFCHYGFEVRTENIKEEKNMNNIYDILVVGGTYHNDNGKDYIVLAFDKDADEAIFLNPENNFTPYVGAKTVRFGSWGSGHYFKTLQEACDWFNHKNDSEGAIEDENNPEGNFCVGTAYDNGSGEFFIDKKSTMEEVGRIIDELLEKDSDADIEISIDLV